MQYQNTTIQSPTATLTEQELFAQFLKMHIQHLTNFGSVSSHYVPWDLLTGGGDLWYDPIVEFGEIVHNSLELSEDPGSDLEALINELEVYLTNLRSIHADFESLKAVKLIMPEEPDEADAEAYEAWELAANAAEDNPRYRPVMDASEAQEAA